jgi:hypothetical protein
MLMNILERLTVVNGVFAQNFVQLARNRDIKMFRDVDLWQLADLAGL